MNETKNLLIRGIGAITNLGNDVDEIWSNLNSEKIVDIVSKPILFDSGLSLSQKRKANRFSEMGIYVSKQAFENCSFDLNSCDKTRIGTIFTTGYGPIVSTMQFSKSIAEENYEFCSPALFANTVHNAGVGHICTLLGLKGVSSVLMGSNNLEYSFMLLNSNKADCILTGSVEEYCQDIIDTFKNNELSKNVLINEAAVAFLVSLENEERYISDAYCTVAETLEFNLNCCPISKMADKTTDISKKIRKSIEKICSDYKVDAFFSSCNGTYFDEIELSAAKEVMSDKVIYVNNVKQLFGETLGSAFNLNVMVGALCLKHDKLPLKLDSSKRNIKNILVSGYDVLGNYLLALLVK